MSEIVKLTPAVVESRKDWAALKHKREKAGARDYEWAEAESNARRAFVKAASEATDRTNEEGLRHDD